MSRSLRVAVGQTGAPTSVVDATLRGILAGAAATASEVYAVKGGPDGLVAGNLEPVRAGDGPRAGARGGSWLGAGRRRITDEDLDAIVAGLTAQGVDVLLLIGGNGTQALLQAVARAASATGSPLHVVGVPKTVDNDLLVVDHTPGYPSAARFLASVVPDLARDHLAMRGVEPVRIVETLGRSTGWLALAATWHRDDPALAPHVVLLPELAYDEDAFVAAVDKALTKDGRAFVVVSEGVDIGDQPEPFHAVNHTQLLHGGVARRLATTVSSRVGVPARGEVLGMVQRCASGLASDTDVREAEQVGNHAARLAADGADGVMAGFIPSASGLQLSAIDLDRVAGLGRPVPDAWCTTDPADLDEFHDWLSPLVA